MIRSLRTAALAVLLMLVVGGLQPAVAARTTSTASVALTQSGLCGDEGGGAVPMDLVFVLDSSGSMSTNDRNRLRVTAAQGFADSMVTGDRIAAVDFTSSARTLIGLSPDPAAVKSALNSVRQSGASEIGRGVTRGLDILEASGDPAKPRFIILLTDGEGPYSSSISQRAVDAGVIVHTVALGSSTNENLLATIAETTGGVFLKSATAEDLVAVFEELRDETAGDPCALGLSVSEQHEVDEGATVTLDAAFADDVDPATVLVSWDYDGDGVYQDAFGPSVAFDARELDGPSTVDVSVIACQTSDHCEAASTVVTVTNVAPAVAGIADRFGIVGEPFDISARWTDPAAADDAPFDVDWSAAAGQSVDGLVSSVSVTPVEGASDHHVAVTDDDGGTDTESSQVTGVETPLQCVADGVDIAVIWPPNHKYVDIGIVAPAQPDGVDVSAEPIYVHQDEPLDALGDGSTAPDARIEDGTVAVRAERSGTGDGRVYTIGYLATAVDGRTCTGEVNVAVPHSKKAKAIDSGTRFDSFTGAAVEPGESPIVELPSTLEPAVEPVSGTVPEGETVALTATFDNAPDGAVVGILGSGPALGDVAVAEELACEPWGDGSTCTATLEYTALSTASGTDAFSMALVADGIAWEIPVTVVVAPVNGPPSLALAPTGIDMLEDGEPVGIRASGWDSETPAGDLVYSVAATPAHGTLTSGTDTLAVGETFTRAVRVVYVPDPDFAGTDEFTLAVTDTGDGAEAPLTTEQTVAVTVRGIADAPVFQAADLTVDEDASVTWDFEVTDADSALLAAQLSAQPSDGQATLNSVTCEPVGFGSSCLLNVTYTPDADFNGADAFTLTAEDGTLEADFEVTATVREVNDEPTLGDLARETEHATAVTVTRSALLALASAGPANEADQPLTFAIESPSLEVPVSRSGDTWTIAPFADAAGEYDLQVTVCDTGTSAGTPDSACATSTLTLTVFPPNSPPTGDPVSATTDEDVAVEVAVAAVDSDGDALDFSLPGSVADATVELLADDCSTDAGASTCEATIAVTPAPEFNGEITFDVIATDEVDSVTIPVTVAVAAVDDPATVVAPSSVTLTEDGSATVAVLATDIDTPVSDLRVVIDTLPEHGTLLSDGVVMGAGDVIATDAADLVYSPDLDFYGSDQFSVRAQDVAGVASDPVTVALVVTEINDAPTAAPLVEQVDAGDTVSIPSADIVASVQAGADNEADQTLSIEGVELSAEAPASVTATAAGWDIAVASTATGSIAATATVCDNGTTAGEADPLCVDVAISLVVGEAAPDLSAPVLVLGTAVVNVGSQAVITVEAFDASEPVTISATVNGETVPVGADGALRYQADAAGHYEVDVQAVDAFGNSATARTSITVLGTDDGVAPSISFDGVEDGATITDRTPIVGSVDDPALSHWELTVTPTGAFDGDAIRIGSGSGAVANGTLGTVDPTVLTAGQYVLRLEAIDEGGRIAIDERHLTVGAEEKYGIFSMTFTDAVVPVAGTPLTIQRTYASGSRGRDGDFGYGWSLSVNSLRLERDTPMGERWSRDNTGTFLPNFVLVPNASHAVTVFDGSDESIVFDFTPRFLSPAVDGTYARAEWTERTDSGAVLEPLDTREIAWTSGTIISLDDAQVYDPDEYRLTMADGRVFEFSLEDGLTRIEDVRGTVVTISDSAIESTAGAAITLERDGDGRITAISTPGGSETEYSYDQGGNLVAVTDAGGNETTFAYDGSHLLTGIIDPLGRIPSRQEYDADGRLIAVVDADGNRTEIASDPDARTTTVTDRLGHTTVQQYDAEGHLVGQVFADGATESYTVDADGNRLTRTDGEGHTWEATYDSRGNRTSVTDPLGHTRSFTYDARGWLASSANELDQTTSLTYDGNGNVTRVDFPDATFAEYTYDGQGNTLTETDESGRTWTFTYDGQGRRLTSESPGGDLTTYTYDADGRLLSTEAPEGGTTSTTYDARGLATESQNALGGTTTTAFDAAGQRTAMEYATGVSSSMSYDSLGRMTSSTTEGATTTYAYDLEGRVVRVETPAGVVRETEYDSRGRIEEVRENGSVVSSVTYDDAGRVATRTDARGETSSFTYDDAGRLTETSRADGTTVTTTHDPAGRVLTVTAPSGTTTYAYDERGRVVTQSATGMPDVVTTYDAAGRPLTSTDGDGTTTFTYDADGRLATVTDTNGSTASVGYDGDGRRVTVDDAKGHTRAWTYDDAGNLLTFDVEGERQLTQAFDVAGRVTERAIGDAAPTTYAYDSRGHLQSMDAPDAPAVTYTYNATGDRTSVADARGTTTYEYDSRSRLTAIDAPEGSIGYTYDASSRVASMVTAAGTTAYDRDELGRIVTITDPDGGAYALDRDAAGRIESITFPNGVTEEYTFDSAGRPLTVTVANGAAVLATYEVTRDAAGRLATFLDSVDGETRSGGYDYDAGGRLTGVESTSGAGTSASQFEFDAAGNREAVTGDGAGQATFNALDQLVSGGGAEYSYDDSGFLTSITDGSGSTTLSWTAAGELSSVDAPGGMVSYEYDSAGVLVSRTDGARTVGFVNDASQSLPHAVAASDGSWWVYAGARPLAQATPDGAVHYLHTDVRGDVRAVTDELGALTDTFTYSAHGATLDRTGATPVSVGWNGEYADPDTGMVWLRVRWYDPASARFITADPWHGDPSVPTSLNRYLYANADPVNNTDPTGLQAVSLNQQVAAVAVFGALVAIATPGFQQLLADLRMPTISISFPTVWVTDIDWGGLFGDSSETTSTSAETGTPGADVLEASDAPDPAAVAAALAQVKAVNPDSATAINRSGDQYYVYEIYRLGKIAPGPPTEETFKYGITRVGDSRPQSQLSTCMAVMAATCAYKVIALPQGFYSARLTEKSLITAYVLRFGKLPPGNPAGI